MVRQCELLGLARSTRYYAPCGEGPYNEELMRLLDEQYLRTPFYGVERMTTWLRRQGYEVNAKRVRRLMGLAAIYPKPHLSVNSPEARIYPYLLREVTIDHPDQVWAADITYVRMHQGWLYLMAILDWFSRYVVAWEVSVTLEADFCVTALQRALAQNHPEIFNTDQGSQFTSEAFLSPLQDAQVQISMDGRGRVFDNIFIERLWRSFKYEEVYLHDYPTVPEAVGGMGRYFAFYNHERPHQALDDRTPAEVYRPGMTVACPLAQETRRRSLAALRLPGGCAPLAPAASTGLSVRRLLGDECTLN